MNPTIPKLRAQLDERARGGGLVRAVPRIAAAGNPCTNRGFGGHAQVTTNGGKMFRGVPDLRGQMLTETTDGATSWLEWIWSGAPSRRRTLPDEVATTLWLSEDGLIGEAGCSWNPSSATAWRSTRLYSNSHSRRSDHGSPCAAARRVSSEWARFAAPMCSSGLSSDHSSTAGRWAVFDRSVRWIAARPMRLPDGHRYCDAMMGMLLAFEASGAADGFLCWCAGDASHRASFSRIGPPANNAFGRGSDDSHCECCTQ